MQFILASASPRRKELLKQLIDHFQVVTSDCEEKAVFVSPCQYVQELSRQKADAVRNKLGGSSPSAQEYLIIGSDTIVYHNGAILGKPTSTDHARSMLAELSGETHQVYTGVTLLHCSSRHELIESCQFYECTDVSVAQLSPEEIETYISTKEPFDKAGSYGIQGMFAKHIRKIDGDYYNVVGLPLHALYKAMQEHHFLSEF